MDLRIGVIVEGQGEEAAVRTLLERLWYELLGQKDYLEILKPFRHPQGTLRKEEGLKRAVEAVKIDLDSKAPKNKPQLLLMLFDSEGECPAKLGPTLFHWAKEVRSDAEIACVLAHPMFETWFVACASSLSKVNGLPEDLQTPTSPEDIGLGKTWIKKHLPRKYKETIDQARFVAKMSLQEARQNSPSFDKLCRELEIRLKPKPNEVNEQDSENQQ